MAVTAAIAGAAVMVGTTAYSMKSSADARSDAQNAANDQAKKQDDLQKQYLQQQSDATAAAAETKKQQDLKARLQSTSANQGSMGTILTSPLGIQNSAPSTGGKTLLGM